MAVEKISKERQTLGKNNVFEFTWNKKHSLKQVASRKYTMEKKIFAAVTFEVFLIVSIWTD